MIKIPHKRLFGLIGPPRIGKDEVANFLKNTRNFAIFAFADQIKEEYGITKEAFEAAKATGEIERLRQELWNFSAAIREKDPTYFIRGVITKVEASDTSAVITDIRTPLEMQEVMHCNVPIRRIYRVRGNTPDIENGYIAGSKILEGDDSIQGLKIIINDKTGLAFFHQDLEKFFFHEDLDDMLSVKS